MIKIQDFVKDFQNAHVINTKSEPNAIGEYITEKLEVKKYVPFRDKKQAMEMVVSQNIREIDGIKKNDQIGQYLSFIIATLSLHTNLEWSEDPVVDYDLLAESGLLAQIIAEFQNDYEECDVLLKMALASELEDNNVNVLVGHFLDGVLKKLDGVGSVLKEKFEDFNLKDVLGTDIQKEDLSQLIGLLDKLK